MSVVTAPVEWTGYDAGARRSRWARLLRGPETDAAWVRPALLAVLAVTAVLYIADLSASGYANSFYAAAVEAGTKSWKAMLFGSFDSSNFITVDKPPASLWVMEIAGRIFGFSSWSMLVPQALEGVATVAVVYATVRRRFSAGAGLLAAAVLACSPVAALIFRFNNPDALLVLLMTVGAYAVLRGLETARTPAGTRWLAIAGVAIGFAFLTKSLQALLVVPAFGAVWLFAAEVSWKRRAFQLGTGLMAMVLSAGWWLATVTLWPVTSRPYIGGSQDNSVWNLIFGYNGFGRLTGNETGSVGGGGSGGGAGAGRWGATGITRLFGSDMGSQIAWLLPAALILTVTMLVIWRRRSRTDPRRAQVLLWLLWLVVTGLTFSYARGIIHPYYTVALAPPIAALVGIGAAELWQRRGSQGARLGLAVAVLVSALWAYVLLDRSPTWNPWLRWLVLLGGIGVAIAILAAPYARRAGFAVAAVAVIAVLAGPAAYSTETAATPHTGALPSAGPAVTSTDFLSGQSTSGPGGGFGAAPGGPPGGLGAPGGRSFGHRPFGTGNSPAGTGGSHGGALPGAGLPGGALPGVRRLGGQLPGMGRTGNGIGTGRGMGGAGSLPARAGAAGNLLDAGTVSSRLASVIGENAASYRWVAAAVSAESAAGFQLASGEPVMAIGGFNGTDPAPTLAEFQRYVAAGDIHYFVASRGGGFGAPMGGGSSSSAASRIAVWVESHFRSRTVDGVTLYDLTSPTTSSSATNSMSGTGI